MSADSPVSNNSPAPSSDPVSDGVGTASASRKRTVSGDRSVAATPVSNGATPHVDQSSKAAGDVPSAPRWRAASISPAAEVVSDSANFRRRFERLVFDAQERACSELESLEREAGGTATFRVDRYMREQGGGGVACVLSDGLVVEKGGVNVSVITGTLTEAAARQMTERGHAGLKAGCDFFASGISSVIHPRSPHCPTVHFNYRYFEVVNEAGETIWWFGGGTDLTPYYLVDEDCRQFHESLKQVCDRHDNTYYPKFKEWCDRYFFLPHRSEARGVGGIFFDDLTGDRDTTFSFVTDSAMAAISGSYAPILRRRRSLPNTESERQWQLLRRGRYVEFNLLHDRGTKFGLFTPGSRIESILMSLPNLAAWEYCHEPAEGSREAELWDVLKTPREWL